MACHHPMRAWRRKNGTISLEKRTGNDDDHYLQLPCGNCLGCRAARAKAWALRCSLELQQHDNATAAHLTYTEENVPLTLQKRDLQLAIKRLRRSLAAKPIRFFGCGEYGEKRGRPHYHAILFGLNYLEHRQAIEDAWELGRVQTTPATPAAIAYIAGYTAKKIGYKQQHPEGITDPETGEWSEWQPPFLQMSRRPGIGANARTEHRTSWRLYAIQNGYRQPVPRYLHEAWKATATQEEIEQLEYEKYKITRTRENTERARAAQEQIEIARQALLADKRSQ